MTTVVAGPIPIIEFKNPTREILRMKGIGGLTLSEIETMVRKDAFIYSEESTKTITWTKNAVTWIRREDGTLQIMARNEEIEYRFIAAKLR